jgi:hypothetical protein
MLMRHTIFTVAFVGLCALSGHSADAQIESRHGERQFDHNRSSRPFGSWSITIDKARHRFEVLRAFSDEAVLDHETNLVWERSPRSKPSTWLEAVGDCYGRTVGDRLGWRLASIEELTSLVDPTQSLPQFLPPNHPFNVDESIGREYWSSTSLASIPPNAFIIRTSPFEGPFVGVTIKSFRVPLGWCVRGGQGPSPDVTSD